MAGNIPGGWSVDPQMQACNLPQHVATAYTEATKGLVGASYTPVLYCGSQVVNGTNYMLICKQVLATKEPLPALTKMTIHAPLQGEAVILNIEALEPFTRR